MGGIIVDDIFSASGELYTVHAFAFAYQATLAVLHVHGIGIALERRDFGTHDNHFLCLFVEAHDALHNPRTASELTVGQFTFLGGFEYIQVVVSVALALEDELVFVPWQEKNRVLRFHILRMLFFVEHTFLFAGLGIVFHQLGMVLVTVQFEHVDALFVRTPAHVGEVSIGRITCLQVDSFLGSRIVDTYGYLMAGHACHRVLVRFQGSDASRCIYLRIVGHHALVHAVESHQVALRTPEDTSVDAEFIAVNALTTEYAFRFVSYLMSVHIEVVADGIGDMSAYRVQVHIGIRFLRQVIAGSYGTCHPVVYGITLALGQLYFGLVRPWIAQRIEGTYRFDTGFLQCLVHGFEGEEYTFFAVLRVDGLYLSHFGFDAQVAPPCEAMQVVWLEVEIVVTSRHQVFQREALLVLCHHHGCGHKDDC